MGRRMRSTERGWRALMVHRALMNPLRTGWYGWQLLSHKLIRRLNPLFLIVLLVSNLALIGHGWFYDLTALAQLLFYGMGCWRSPFRRCGGSARPDWPRFSSLPMWPCCAASSVTTAATRA